MTKMMFIRPPFKGMGRYVPPHLGIATLYNYLHGKFDWIEFSLVDALADALDEEQIVKAINYSRPDILAITIKTMQVKQAKEIIERVKDIYNPLIICGGNHVSVSPQEFVRCGADYAIVGEGEEAIEKIIQHEFGHYEESLDDCVNICTKNNVERSGFEPKVCVHGSDIPAPDWSIFDLTKYNENIHINKSRQALPVMASRGCPFKCDFCSTHLTWTTKVRYRNPIDVFNEIKNNQIKWGISDYHFYDDNLMINPEWVDQFTELIISTGLKINWICLSRPEIISSLDDGIVEILSPVIAGFAYGLFGIQAVLLATLVSELVAFLLTLMLRDRAKNMTENPGVMNKQSLFHEAMTSYKEAIVSLQEYNYVLGVILFAPLFNFFVSPLFSVTVPHFIRITTKSSIEIYTAYNLALGIASVVAPFIAMWLIRDKAEHKANLRGTIIYAFLMLILSFVTQSFSSIQPATLLSIIAGAMVLAVIIITLMSIATTITVKTSIPEQVLGRIASIIQLCAIVSTPLGQLLYGYFADRFPIFLSFACSSLGLLATYVIMKKTYKKLKREKQKNGY